MTYDVGISISKTEANNALNTAMEFVSVIRDIIQTGESADSIQILTLLRKRRN